jgi:SH3-like domain-containing protein
MAHVRRTSILAVIWLLCPTLLWAQTLPDATPGKPGVSTQAPAKPAPKPPVPQTPSPQTQRDTKAKPAPRHPTAPPPAPVVAPAPTPEVVPPDTASSAPKQGSVTGLPLPRFAALRSDDVNLRVGPGTRYPIGWVYKRRDLPVEIEREYEVWRLVSDQEGNRGWVHQATLSGRRTFVVREVTRTLRRTPETGAAAVAILKPGVVGRIITCAATAAWCEVQVSEYRGYLKRDEFWGVFPGEAVNP